MATILNQGLYRTLGIQFEYKIKFQEFLSEAIESPLVVDYDVDNNTPENREAIYTQFEKCGPSMGFEAKKAAYNLLELVSEALIANADVPASDETLLNEQLLNVTNYVGMEGEEDFHFMVSTFNTAETISKIIGEVVPSVVPVQTGPIFTLQLIDGGSGYSDNANNDTATDVVVAIDSTEDTNPAGYSAGDALVALVDGVVTDVVVGDGGNGFYIGQIVQLNIDTGSGATQGTPALAKVTELD